MHIKSILISPPNTLYIIETLGFAEIHVLNLQNTINNITLLDLPGGHFLFG